jgi:transglutaminase-like putative cysteine protease
MGHVQSRPYLIGNRHGRPTCKGGSPLVYVTRSLVYTIPLYSTGRLFCTNKQAIFYISKHHASFLSQQNLLYCSAQKWRVQYTHHPRNGSTTSLPLSSTSHTSPQPTQAYVSWFPTRIRAHFPIAGNHQNSLAGQFSHCRNPQYHSP